MRYRETKEKRSRMVQSRHLGLYGIFPDLYFFECWTWINKLLFAILTLFLIIFNL